MDNNTEYRDLNMTPREIVEELDRHIVGQKEAKRAVANALIHHNDMEVYVLAAILVSYFADVLHTNLSQR